MRDVHGRPDYEIAVIENITQRKMAEEALRALTDTLEQQVAERTELAETRSRQLQELTIELIEAEERERQRIADLLHDDLQQYLASAWMQVQMTRERHPSIELLENVESALKESIEKSRNLSHELTPPVLQQGNLADTVEWLGLSRLAQGANSIGCNLDIKSAPGQGSRITLTVPVSLVEDD